MGIRLSEPVWSMVARSPRQSSLRPPPFWPRLHCEAARAADPLAVRNQIGDRGGCRCWRWRPVPATSRRRGSAEAGCVSVRASCPSDTS